MSAYKKYIGDLFVTLRFYIAAGACIVLYTVASFYEPLLPFINIIFIFLCLLTAADYFFMFVFFRAPEASRTISDRLSNGEENKVSLSINNKMPFIIQAEIIDELPEQLQERTLLMKKTLLPREQVTVKYVLKPVQRGPYHFGNIVLFLQSQLGLVKRRQDIPAAETVKVYPSFTKLGQYALMSRATSAEQGSRRMRKIGQSMEFEQIKDYVTGDDIRAINWKATARKGSLMVNSYTDERSQQVYCIIDKGRLMKMPFYGLSLLDYAINATLALSNICLQKQDKIGLISFSDKPGSIVAADRKPVQRENIMQVLYKESTGFMESDYEMLYMQVRNKIKQRSLLILFTNFESLNGLKRQISYLRSIARHHLLLVIFFENTELTKLSTAEAHNTEDVYVKTIADKFAYEKRMVVKELQQYGILSVLTSPEQLTVNAINKYLELKTKQAI
jgi:uncharacterized protein (DUF58 family)